LFVGAAAITLIIWQDYGVTWDERVHIDYGDALFDYYATLGADTRAVTHGDRHYGPLYDFLGGALRAVSRLPPYQTMRLLGACAGLLGGVAVLALGRLLGGPVAGFASLLALIVTPAYVGHAFNNPKDLPFAAAYAWALWAIARVATDLPRVQLGRWVTASVLLGAAAGVRIAGLLAWCYLGATCVVFGLQSIAAGGRRELGKLLRLGLVVVGCLAGAYVLLLALWPWAAQAPLHNVRSALTTAGNYSGWKGTTFFDGQLLTTSELPWDYLLQYLLRQLPELVLLGATCELLWVCRDTGRAILRGQPLPLVRGLVVVAVFAPPAYALLRHTPVYDGMRHVLFIVPPACVATGVVFSRMMAWAQERGRVALLAIVAMTAAGLAHPARSLVALHPYQYIYYNWASGGLPAAAGRWELDYYGHSYKEMHRRLAEHLWRKDPLDYVSREHVIATCGASFFHYLDDQTMGPFRIELTRKTKRAEFFMAYTRHNCHRQARRLRAGPELMRVERDGVLLNIVRPMGQPVPARGSRGF
jgi:hypothetical protein